MTDSNSDQQLGGDDQLLVDLYQCFVEDYKHSVEDYQHPVDDYQHVGDDYQDSGDDYQDSGDGDRHSSVGSQLSSDQKARSCIYLNSFPKGKDTFGPSTAKHFDFWVRYTIWSIQPYARKVVLAVDGAVHGFRAGYGLVSEVYERSVRLPDHTSCLEAELLALDNALDILGKIAGNPSRTERIAVVLTDCKSALKRLLNRPTCPASQFMWNKIDYLQKRFKLLIIWVPARVGVKLHDLAHQAAVHGCNREYNEKRVPFLAKYGPLVWDREERERNYVETLIKELGMHMSCNLPDYRNRTKSLREHLAEFFCDSYPELTFSLRNCVSCNRLACFPCRECALKCLMNLSYRNPFPVKALIEPPQTSAPRPTISTTTGVSAIIISPQVTPRADHGIAELPRAKNQRLVLQPVTQRNACHRLKLPAFETSKAVNLANEKPQDIRRTYKALRAFDQCFEAMQDAINDHFLASQIFYEQFMKPQTIPRPIVSLSNIIRCLAMTKKHRKQLALAQAPQKPRLVSQIDHQPSPTPQIAHQPYWSPPTYRSVAAELNYQRQVVRRISYEYYGASSTYQSYDSSSYLYHGYEGSLGYKQRLAATRLYLQRLASEAYYQRYADSHINQQRSAYGSYYHW